MPLKTLSEYDEQCLLVEYLELKNLKFSKIAQETWAKNWGVIMKNKKSGVRKGVPDMLVIIPGKEKDKLIFIEMKKKKGNVATQEQKEWQCALNRCEGVRSYICFGFEESKEVVDSILKEV
jgi:hypothetical protein